MHRALSRAQEILNKGFDSVKSGAYKPASRRGAGIVPKLPEARRSLFDIVNREKGCVGGGPGSRRLDPKQTHLDKP